MKRIYIDVGSSTIKVYREGVKGKLDLLETKSLHFKQDFDSDSGISQQNKNALIEFTQEVVNKHPKAQIKVYATALFRKLNDAARRLMIDEFFRQTGLFFNIVPHDLEGHYLEQALSAEYIAEEPILLLNIGGGSTEIVVRKGGETLDRYNIELGVGTVLQDSPFLNEEISRHDLQEVVSAITKKLPTIKHKIPYAIYNGGELTYMQLVGYKLQKNNIFKDKDHPFVIKTQDFASKNSEVFSKTKLSKLEALMPNDPLWMHGARACSAIAQAVVEHFGVSHIIPSDSNMVHGIAKQEFRSVVLSGSFRKHLDYILQVKEELESKDTQVLSPRFEKPKNPGEEFVIFEGEENWSPLELERYHLDMIDKCDALVVCSYEGYVGASAMTEIGYAQSLGKRVIFTEKPTEFLLQTLPAEVGM